MTLRSNSLRRARPLLGTLVEVHAAGATRAILESGVAAAFAAVARVQRLMSFHAPDSELSLLNRHAARRPVTVHEWTWGVLRAASDLWEASGGLFDCAVAPVLAAAGFLPRSLRRIGSLRDASMGEVELRWPRRVRYARPLLLDLGGIAKGFAVDRAVDALRAAGVRQGAVNAGGDLRIFGPEPESVHVRSPRRPGELICIGSHAEVAVATSAAYCSMRELDGEPLNPIVDPRRGCCITGHRSATVLAEECMLADALTKTLLLARPGHATLPAKFAARGLLLG